MTLRRHPRTLLVGALATALVAVSAAGSLADDTVPTQQDVASAQSAVTAKARDVASVQAQLAIANDHLRGAAISAAQATEAYNGARWRLQQAQARTTLAEAHQAQAEADLADQQTAITESLVASYQDAPALQALSAIVESDGIQAATEQATTFDNAQSAMDAQYDAFRATSTLAEVAADQADAARAEAADAQAEAKRARDAAAEAERSAARQAQEIAGQKEQLIAELARLQGISVKLAEQRQVALEAEAAAAAGHQPPGGGDGGGGAGQPAPDPQPSPDPQPTPDPTPSPDPDPEPAPDPDPPAPGSGADAAIAFAKAQLGEPYRWGAAGPDAWDCSGLTMGSWAAGGKALPHYSVAQYQQSTPITAAQLRPGDLVFWGSSSRSFSIYHVALYVGDGQMIHAPRTGRPVSLESMYYWIPPNFFARP